MTSSSRMKAICARTRAEDQEAKGRLTSTEEPFGYIRLRRAEDFGQRERLKSGGKHLLGCGTFFKRTEAHGCQWRKLKQRATRQELTALDASAVIDPQQRKILTHKEKCSSIR
mmetsp:Transcript_35702/g.80504  ORF Transcript_35702/g.80504 Transcript_35702/m.80504 type:complete len:113 (+) Transcript_35702:51-389(+)